MAQNIYQFFIEPSLQELFRDRLTGLPLDSGYIVFYRDKARTEPKPVYKLSGTPNDPVYEVLPNPLPLTGIGSTSDGLGNDIKIYYNPFDEDGDVDLYYIEVYSNDGVLQFTREGWPQQIDTSSDANLTFIENYYQDSQFLYHFDLPDNGVIPAGQTTTNLSYGGWVFLLPDGFTSVNTVTFNRFPDYVENPTVSPRYYANFSVVNPNPAETFKDFVWVNNNVNFLADKTVTLQLEGISNNGFPTNVEIFYQKVYGDGGSPTDTIFVDTFTIDPTDWAKYTTSFTISSNLAKTIGPNDDDEIRFIVRLPSDLVIDLSFVNFMLVEGQFSVLDHPDVSEYQSKLNALASSIQAPAFDGSNDGDVLTLGGTTTTAVGADGTPLAALIWSPAVPVGSIISYAAEDVPVGYLSCNGLSYDLVGINALDSYVRLFDVIGFSWGTGASTFLATDTGTSQATYTATEKGACIAPNPHMSGLTITVTQPGSPTDQEVSTIDTIAANLIPAGSYYEFFSPDGRSTVWWFEIDNAGSSPESLFPTSLIQKISLQSTDTAEQVVNAIIANTTNTQVRVPDLRGEFLRGWDDGRGLDPDANTRLNYNQSQTIGDVVGSRQSDALQDHSHSEGSQYRFLTRDTSIPNDKAAPGGNDYNIRQPQTTGNITPGFRISTETRPVNAYVQFIIKT